MPKLSYFDLYGRAEAARMMLWKAGVAYEDVRVGATFAELKPTLEYGQVPCLELDDGTKLVQTDAILAYLAATHGFAPKDPMDCYKAQHLLSYVNEDFMTRKFYKWFQAKRKTSQQLSSLSSPLTSQPCLPFSTRRLELTSSSLETPFLWLISVLEA